MYNKQIIDIDNIDLHLNHSPLYKAYRHFYTYNSLQGDIILSSYFAFQIISAINCGV